MAADNNIFGNNMVDPNQRIAANSAQIQRNNAQINNLSGNGGYMTPNTYGNGGYMNGGYYSQQPAQPQFLKCRPVTSIEEARAAQVDLDGSLWVFTDTAHGKIYTKQIRNDGASAFCTYVYTEENQNNYNYNNYVTKDELNNTVNTAVQYILNMLPKQQPVNSSQSAVAADTKNDKTSTLAF